MPKIKAVLILINAVIFMTSTLLYDSDFYRWTIEQVERLRLGKWDSLDIENLAEEIESLGSQKRSELENRLAILLGHLSKWDLQPRLRGKSWRSNGLFCVSQSAIAGTRYKLEEIRLSDAEENRILYEYRRPSLRSVWKSLTGF